MKKTALGLGQALVAIAVCVLLVGLTACPSTPPAPTTTAPTASQPAGSVAPTAKASPSKIVVVPPKVTGAPRVVGGKLIIAPKEGFVGQSNAIWVQLDITNINLVNPKATNVEGEGHVNFYVDYEPPTAAGAKGALPSPVPKGARIYVGGSGIAMNLGYQWKSLSNGNHTLYAQVVQNDDTPFNPPIMDKVNITINYTPPPSGSPTPAAK